MDARLCRKHESQHLKVARFGDNMREVAVTEGNKVSAQIQFGYSVNGYALGDLEQVVNEVSHSDISALVEEYEASYILTDAVKTAVQNARICWMLHALS